MPFPINPIDGERYTNVLGTTYVYRSSDNIWNMDGTNLQSVTGLIGYTGLQGQTGPQGVTGLRGSTGLAGPTFNPDNNVFTTRLIQDTIYTGISAITGLSFLVDNINCTYRFNSRIKTSGVDQYLSFSGPSLTYTDGFMHNIGNALMSISYPYMLNIDGLSYLITGFFRPKATGYHYFLFSGYGVVYNSSYIIVEKIN